MTEAKGHILDMSNIYQKIDNILKEISKDDNEEELIRFAKGEITCFNENYVSKDEVYESLIQDSPNDSICIA